MIPRNKIISYHVARKVMELYQSGKSPEIISKELHVSPTVVNRILSGQ